MRPDNVRPDDQRLAAAKMTQNCAPAPSLRKTRAVQAGCQRIANAALKIEIAFKLAERQQDGLARDLLTAGRDCPDQSRYGPVIWPLNLP